MIPPICYFFIQNLPEINFCSIYKMNLFSPEMSISISRLYGPDRPHSETLFVYIIIVIKKRVMKQRTAKTPFEQIDWNSGILHCNFDCFLEK